MLVFRYTLRIVRPAVLNSFLIFSLAALSFADDASFRHVRVPNLKGEHIKAELTFSDRDKALELRPKKGAAVNIPYGQIDKAAYQYTSELTIGLGEAKNHWLQIDYHEQDVHKTVLVLMEKRDYLHILDALKAHTGIDADIVGNADKRHENLWHKN